MKRLCIQGNASYE